MTWRSWVPFPQDTEHCKYKQGDQMKVKFDLYVCGGSVVGKVRYQMSEVYQ